LKTTFAMPFRTGRAHHTTPTTTQRRGGRGLFSQRQPAHHTTSTSTQRRGLFSQKQPAHHTTSTSTSTQRRGLFSQKQPVHHQKRHATMGDKISGAMLKLKGSLTHRPGQKAAGTRRMHGTDGRGSHRSGRRY
jgi:hypothetical protein